MKKKIFSLALALTLLVSATACGGSNDAGSASQEPAGDPVTIYVSAAASMTESLNQIIADYTEANKNVTIVPTYDSSGTLLTQIQAGADCDLFISAAQKQMNAIDEVNGGEGYEGTNYVLDGTRVDLLENKCALVVSESSDKGIDSWETFEAAIKGAQSSSDLIFCMGNADVPVGQYTSTILTNLGLDEADMVSKGIVTYGSNVKEVTSQISTGAADCGIIYATDAFSAGMDVIATADAELTGKKVIYPAAVMSNSANPDAAKAFLEYLQSEEAMAVFEGVGFSPAA